ncbi:MAG: Ig-like domain repeat protein, partial [Armatimonadetes bacterium]|nr:Ig-like domain repeat protein [Armatimonadota bacterium]
TLTKTTGATAVAGLQLEFRIGNSGAWTDAAALTDATGKASASLTAPATAGDATINARWAGSTHYAASSDTATLAVKTATTITADAVTCYASDTITLTGTLKKTSDSTAISGKTIQFKVDTGGTWTNASAATGADGKATLSATAPATTGAHTIYVRFQGDTDYAASDASNTLTIDAADGTTLVADDASAAPSASVTVSATLTKTTGATAVAGLQLEFRIGDSGAWTNAAALTDATGKASASLTAPATTGDHTINARWAGSTHYAASSDTATLKVKTPTTITADAVTCYASDTITLTGTLTALSGKTIQFKIDAGGTWTNASAATGADGKATLSVTAPATTGAHTIYVRFEGDTDYVASSASNTLTVSVADATTLVADDASALPGAAVTLSATITKTTGGSAISGLQLQFRIGDSGSWTNAAALTDATGKASVSLTAPATAGSYTINAKYAGNTQFAEATDSASLSVARPTTITADAATCYASDTITLTGTLTKTSDSGALSGKTIQFKVDAGGTWTNASAVTGADGKATLSVTAPATTGAHTIYVRFEGDTDYVASNASNTLTIKAPDATTLTVDNKRGRVGVAVTLTATLTRTTGGAGVSGKTVEFRIGSTGPWTAASAATDADGKASASLTAPAAAGSHAIEARFAGDAHDAVSSGSGTLETVVPQATVTVCQNRTCGMGDTMELLAYLWRPGGTVGVAGKTLQFRFNGGAWNDAPAVTQANGKSVYQITAPSAAGAYPFEARFAGDVDDLDSAGSATLAVTKRATYITAPERFGDAGTTVNIAAILYHAKPNGDLVPLSGKTVTLQIPLLSITRTAVTAANGSVNIPVAISQKTGGYIPFTVAYAGDDDYQAFTQPSALDIKHKTLLTVVDRSAGRGDKVTLSANLVRASGAPLGGKTLYLRINGGSWLATAPTQPANGRGNVDTVVDLPAGTYTIDAKFDGDADEMASTGSGALTVTAKAATYCLTAARTAKQGTSVNLGAYVYRQSTMAPLAGKPLNFYIDGTKINASALITAADGKATCVHTLAEAVGAHSLVVKFEDGGDPAFYTSQSAPVTVTITP